VLNYNIFGGVVLTSATMSDGTMISVVGMRVCPILTMPKPKPKNRPLPRQKMNNNIIISLTYIYSGGGCSATTNHQNGKLKCSGAIDTTLVISVTSPDVHEILPTTTLIAPGEMFTLLDPNFHFSTPPQTKIILTNLNNNNNDNDNDKELLSLHTACNKPMVIGDVYGSITLTSATYSDGTIVDVNGMNICMPMPHTTKHKSKPHSLRSNI